MKLLSDRHKEAFLGSIDFDVEGKFSSLTKKEADFEYLQEVSAVYSSNIEGNPMDVNSFMNSKTPSGPKPKEFREIVDLKNAYEFAQKNSLVEENLLKTHEILAKLFVSKGNCGVYRQDSVGVFSSRGLVYMAVEAENVEQEMKKLFEDIDALLKRKMSAWESLYWAAYIHLMFAHIHPFADGNGRAARLLEKWFLASKIGKAAWYIESEKYYKEHVQEYYKNINLGVNYYESDYEKALPFLLMFLSAMRK